MQEKTIQFHEVHWKPFRPYAGEDSIFSLTARTFFGQEPKDNTEARGKMIACKVIVGSDGIGKSVLSDGWRYDTALMSLWFSGDMMTYSWLITERGARGQELARGFAASHDGAVRAAFSRASELANACVDECLYQCVEAIGRERAAATK